MLQSLLLLQKRGGVQRRGRAGRTQWDGNDPVSIGVSRREQRPGRTPGPQPREKLIQPADYSTAGDSKCFREDKKNERGHLHINVIQTFYFFKVASFEDKHAGGGE
ncbi:hypothetical protein F2P81_018392 [Scophthalmus maximus]|uniref:Uncharacterized protein n=1 Tax=Scophthalmus maximus TaxID=52904 RepID=A0A6A4S835_SCOMX|nr:hypothetical protein F2P81_018392 [Scophthalmus maximus]